MSLCINKISFLLKLLENYKFDIYVKMREDGYSINQILDFIDGYSLVLEEAYKAAFNNIPHHEDDQDLTTIVFEDHSDFLKAYDVLINNICKKKYMYDGWSIIGAKYILCLIRYYMNNVIYGNIDEVEDFYLNIPNKDNPNSYEWDERDWDYDFFNEEI